MTRIVTTHYRYKRPPRTRKAVALDVPRITTIRRAPPSDEVVKPSERLARPETRPVIVTAKNPRRGRFGDVPDMTPEEHERRGDAAVALFRELTRRVRE
jgi:hypothetical protein